MQVKKFEAHSMKEALEMVKTNLGPEAIILQAKDNTGGFGLGGRSSVEITAAVSENMLTQKKLAESKMTVKAKEKFQNIPAARQKKYINKFIENRSVEAQALTKRRYVDIIDESDSTGDHDFTPEGMTGISVDRAMNLDAKALPSQVSSTDRIRQAAQSAWAAVQDTVEPKKRPTTEPLLAPTGHEVLALKKEIRDLKTIISGFQKMPQTLLSTHPGANEGISYELSGMFDKLTRAGLSAENSTLMLRQAQQKLPEAARKKQPFVDAWVAKHILDTVQISDPAKDKAKYHVFLGPAGQGKTSTLVKFASELVIKQRKKVVILSADTSRVGASEQLKIFSQILNVPFAIVRGPHEMQKVEQNLKGIDHVLIDFPGLQLRSAEESAFISQMLPRDIAQRRLHYVQSVLAKDENAFEVFNAYKQFGMSDVIFTSLDESCQHGIIYNFQKRFNIPLHSFGIGPNIPEDFEYASRERVVDLIFKLTKLKNRRSQP